jgi:hypothetical protein
MPTMVFSSPKKYWRALCTNTVKPETSVNGEQCLACVVPVSMPGTGTGTGGCGTSKWVWDSFVFFMIEDHCTNGGSPVPPTGSYPIYTVLDVPCDCP